MKYWYAVMMDREDTDWGTGSFDLDIAMSMVKKHYPDGHVAVIDASYDEDGAAHSDGVCVDVIFPD